VLRQTVFYTPTTVRVYEGETVAGRLSCAPNARNNRDLDIVITYTSRGETHTMEYKMCVFLSCAGFEFFFGSSLFE
jgi:protein arginine N-methyltransferase 1